MKHKILLSAIIAASTMALTGCSGSFLDAEQKSDISADDYFATSEGFENLATAPYYKLRALYGGSPLLFCSGTDLYTKGRSEYASTTLSNYNTLVSTDKDVLSFYQACYDGIQQANTVIYYAEGNQARQHRAVEAKVLKAYYYYLLSQQFGGVPISDAYINSPVTSMPRKTQAEVYQYIVGLLEADDVKEQLKGDFNIHTGRVSMRFVYNLLAKTYLAWAWDTDVQATDAGLKEGEAATVTSTEKFLKAASYADLALATSYTEPGQTPTLSALNDDFSNLWDIKNENNASDEIFAIQYKRGLAGQDETTQGNQQQSYFSSYYNDDTGADETDPGQTKYTSSTYCPSLKLLYLYEPNDVRFDATFMVTHLVKYKYFYTKQGDGNAYDVYGYYPAWYTDLSAANLTRIKAQDGYTNARIYSSSDPCVKLISGRGGRLVQGTQPYSESLATVGNTLCVRKFDDYNSKRNGTSGVSFHNIVLAHMAETYLIAAEAYYMGGNSSEALNRLNTVRKRAYKGAEGGELASWSSYTRHYSDGTIQSINNGQGISQVPKITGTDLDPIDIILDERARELCGEYYRWMDLRRTKRIIDYNIKYGSDVIKQLSDPKSAFVGKDGKNKWFRPIPEDEINLNEGMTQADQNPGY